MILRMNRPGLLLATLAVCAGFCGERFILAQAGPAAAPASATRVQVLYVGCASDGQIGPQAAPVGKSKTVSIPAAIAQRLAWYEAENGPGVLAPRGWHCFSTYGSNGASLFVSPDPIDAKMLFSDTWNGFSGQAVQISFSFGDTSGRFEVAKIIARVFPAYKQFVQDLIEESHEPASEYPFGPYPHDNLTYFAKNVVEFETPANAEGLGTDSLLQANGSTIDGVAIIVGEDTDLIQLTMRLAQKERDLIPFIIRQAEREARAGAQ